MITAWHYAGSAIVTNTGRADIPPRSWFGEQLELDLESTPTLSKPARSHANSQPEATLKSTPISPSPHHADEDRDTNRNSK